MSSDRLFYSPLLSPIRRGVCVCHVTAGVGVSSVLVEELQLGWRRHIGLQAVVFLAF